MLYVVIFVCSFIAFGISVICGGGAGLILLSVLNRFLPVIQVPAVLSIGTSSSSFSRVIIFYRDINWKIVQFFLPTALPGVLLGSWMLTYVNSLWVELIMALFLIGNLPQVFKGKDYKTEEKELGMSNLLTIGFFAGLTSGFISAGGILFNKFYMKIGMTNQQIVATRAANEIVLNIVKLIIYIYLGLFTMTSLKIGIVVGCAAILSSYIMKKIIPRISIKWFYTLGFSTMVVSGVVMLISFFEKFHR
ncbi:sulfite exporter TauE/SafE family protein [Chryseobacterium potabilaquae]|uniref:Probable membrane transporter protein n=1 Tax=Chryseobacterium potabilaquae TaxID=2675057 RepID=A0A6N4X3Y6_9FLAO|nr:sulfite exporter TauE/SafE family protein [Chryseobacterium potabilaquae]CAA7194142.1 hypothetical protein CHRY9293_00519 [Chryseobacterium potabilaquae]